MGHFHTVGVMNPIFSRHNGAVFSHRNNQIFHTPLLKRFRDQLHICKVDPIVHTDGVLGKDCRLVFVGRDVGSAGEQLI